MYVKLIIKHMLACARLKLELKFEIQSQARQIKQARSSQVRTSSIIFVHAKLELVERSLILA